MLFSTRELNENKLRNEFSVRSWKRVAARLRAIHCESVEFNNLFSIRDPYFDQQVKELKDGLPEKQLKKREATNVSS